jgi:predicted acylesterase/phospholipase RssA
MSRTALVLSGGGMFGAYQAGVWRVLSRRISPQMVVGASVGALNGWLIASGMTAEDLVDTWLDPAAGTLMTYALLRFPQGGVFDPQPLRDRAKHLVEHYMPRIDYGAAMLRLPWLERALVRNAEVSWRHLVASCSVPLGFPPVRIDDGVYCDGGLLEPTPVWAAAAMGATRVIAVNASRFVPPRALGIVAAGTRWLVKKRPRAEEGLEPSLEVTLISPQHFLGRMRDGAAWRRENIERWIDLGEADADTAVNGIMAPRGDSVQDVESAAL